MQIVYYFHEAYVQAHILPSATAPDSISLRYRETTVYELTGKRAAIKKMNN